jgi:hypothetical protein
MKKIIFGVCLLIAGSAWAQDKYVPEIKQGTKLAYSAYVNGQTFPVTFSFDSITTGYIKLGWNVEGFGNGTWVMKSKSLESGLKGFWGQPSPGTEEVLADDQAVLVFSKAQWDQLQKDKKIDLDNQSFSVKTPTEQQQLKIAGKAVDAFFAENAAGSTRIWILNNAFFPVMLKIEGNSLGADLTINSVE